MAKHVLFKVWDTIVGSAAQREQFLLNAHTTLHIPPDYSGVQITSLFISPELSAERLAEMEREGEDKTPDYKAPSFISYFDIRLEDTQDTAPLVSVLRSEALRDTVEYSYEPPYGNEPVGANANPGFRRQGYLKRAGININTVWPRPNGKGFPGLDGQGVRFADVERGWRLDHPDLMSEGVARIELAYGDNNPSRNIQSHGTAVMGIVVAVDNTTNIIGVAPNAARVRAYSYWHFTSDEDPLMAIMLANSDSGPGDVLLIERQVVGRINGELHLLPEETEPFAFNIIANACARGVIVIEPAGNDGVNIDEYVFEQGQRRLADRDSGAIIVGGSTRKGARYVNSNFGNRVDCFAWGEEIFTLDNPSFQGTSGSGAIMAGVAMALQGYSLSKSGQPFSPRDLRNLLKNAQLTTHSKNMAVDLIGFMPDVKRIVQHLET